MIKRSFVLFAIFTVLLASGSSANAQGINIETAWDTVTSQNFGGTGATPLSVTEDTITYGSTVPFRLTYDTTGIPYAVPWLYRINNGSWQWGSPYAPANSVGTSIIGASADLSSSAIVDIQALHPQNLNVVATGSDSEGVANLEATFSQFTDAIPIEAQDAKDYALDGAHSAADELVDAVFGSTAAADFILQYNLTPQDVEARKDALRTAMRSGLGGLSDSAIDEIFGVGGANYVVRVGSGNPAKPRITSFISEIPGILEAGATNVLDPNEDLTAVHHFVNLDWNTSGAAELALDGLQPLIQNGSVSGIMEALEDFVFIDSATLSIPASHEAGGFTFSGQLQTGVSGISLNRPQGATIGGSIGISKSDQNSSVGIGGSMSKAWDIENDDWGSLQMLFQAGASW